MGVPSFRFTWLFVELVLDVCWLSAAGFTAFLFHGAFAQRETELAAYLEWWPWFLVVHLSFFVACGMYRESKDLLNVRELRSLLVALLLGHLTLVLLLFLWREPGEHGLWRHVPWLEDWHREWRPGSDVEELSRFVVLATLPFAWVYGTAARMSAFRVLRVLAPRFSLGRKTLIVGTSEGVRRLRRRFLRAPTISQRLIGACVPEEDLERVRDGAPELLGTYGDVLAIARREGVEVVWIAGDPRQDERLEHLLRSLPESIEPRIEVEPLTGYRWVNGPFGTLRMEPLVRRATFYQTAAKRSLDVLLSMTLLVLTSPLLLLTGLLVAVTSGRPVWLRQERIGKDGRTFLLWKFRTMRGEDDARARKPRRNDPRVTRLGRWLRRLSLDELPQLWNVLRGDMSLVGPRPEIARVARTHDEHVRQRLAVAPGITGLWQISAARRRPIPEGLEYDLYYLAHRDLFLDLTILLLTPLAVLRGIGAR